MKTAGSLVLAIACAAVALTCARPPKTRGFRSVEFFSAGNRQVEFTCQVGAHSWKTYTRRTPFRFELEMDTFNPCMCGIDLRFWKTSAGPERLWVWAFDHDSLRVEMSAARPDETLSFSLTNWPWPWPYWEH